ncbi:MAG: metalloregulator ArsR/SmtB family transcription factor [Ilumatobacteraceae bacterium]
MLPDVGPLACCGASVLAGALDEGDAEQLAHGFRALADPARIRLLSIIAASPTGEVCACDLVEPLGRAQPTVSHHLSLLVEAGLLTRTKRGRWAWYRIAPDRIELLRGALAR